MNMKKLFPFVAAMMLALMSASCDKNNPDKYAKPVTGQATQITQNSAVLQGVADMSSLPVGSERGIVVSQTKDAAAGSVIKLVSTDLGSDNFTVYVTGLRAGTEYYYKAFINAGGTYVEGDVKSFTTEKYKPFAIDLGLPSGLKWADCNVGANAPDDYGDYFAWGETEPYYSRREPLTWKEGKSAGYAWASYKFCSSWDSDGKVKVSKYNNDGEFGIVDNKATLDLEDDAARANWGENWRIPTIGDWEELIDNCTIEWTTLGAASGRLLTGPNGTSIFLPAAAVFGGPDIEGIGLFGIYWSSSLFFASRAMTASINSPYTSVGINTLDSNRCSGASVRPVTE